MILGFWGLWAVGLDNNVLAADVGLIQVLPLTVHLIFFDRQVGVIILKLSYFQNFLWDPSFMVKS